jgi:hypothetical protein
MSQPARAVDHPVSERSKLRRELGRLDAVCLLIAAIVVLDTLGAVHRPFRVPGGRLGAWATSALATGWCALAFTAILWPGLGAPHSDAYLPAGFAGDRTGFIVVEVVPIAAVLVGAVAFAGLGRRGERLAAETIAA